jgi:eukaryotic-like serine/threonine-protein kinase
MLGRGGTAEVTAARQLALQREVAVKSLRKDKASPARARQLIREARVLGALQHPGVVPVHLIGTTEDGQPMIVMRRVQGTAWLDFVHQGGHLRAPPGEPDPLEWHLRVLMQVSSAAHFAHSKGLIHRDIKLSNVMIGAHGEVYLVDWGMALAFDPVCDIDAPLARDETEVLGTPGYMAPEMAGVVTDQLRPRTDVFLLGGCLHMILTGKQRHGDGSLLEKLARAWASEPFQYNDRVEPDLAMIATRACRRDPYERYASAESLRQELGRFLSRRTSRRLGLEARLRLRALEELVASDDVLAPEVHQLYAECRFGFREALRDWSDNPDALAGQAAAAQAMAQFELLAGRADHASVLLEELEHPPEALARAVAQKLKTRRRHTEQFKAIQARKRSERSGRFERAVMLYAAAMLWGIVDVALGALDRSGRFHPGYGTLTLISLSHGATIAATVASRRRELLSNMANRRFLMVQGLAVLAPLLLWWMALTVELPVFVGIALLQLLFGIFAAVAAGARPAMLGPAGLFWVGFVLTTLMPTIAWEILGIFSALGMGLAGWTWSRQGRKKKL